MSILTVKNVNHGFGDRIILDDVSFRLLKGEHVGFIGANGEGKSTFMNIITGKLMPDEGSIEWSNKVRAGYMDQHIKLEKGKTIREILREAFKYLFELEKEMVSITDKLSDCTDSEMENLLKDMGDIQEILEHSSFYTLDIKIEEVASGLGLKDIGLDTDVDNLSGGQRTKVLLAKLLLENPDILLLDEPTNYLDEEHIVWLKKFLQNYENAFIIISHDIPFLNSVINLIYHVENGKLTRYVGDYYNFEKQYEQMKRHVEAAYERQQQQINKLETFVAKNKARVATSNMAKSRQKVLDKMEKIELPKNHIRPQFNFQEAGASGKVIFETDKLVIGYNTPLTKPITISMERGQKIALTGTNGLGKTTLLKSLLGILSPISGVVLRGDYQEIGYFEQEIKEKNYNSCIDEFWNEFPSYTQYEVRSALAKCGLTTKHIESKVMVLSGGEQAKVRLCKIINRPTNILVLDEPTNHLDIDAKDELKRTLKSYKGSILLVCHEPEFYNDIITDIWDCEKWTTKLI